MEMVGQLQTIGRDLSQSVQQLQIDYIRTSSTNDRLQHTVAYLQKRVEEISIERDREREASTTFHSSPHQLLRDHGRTGIENANQDLSSTAAASSNVIHYPASPLDKSEQSPRQDSPKSLVVSSYPAAKNQRQQVRDLSRPPNIPNPPSNLAVPTSNLVPPNTLGSSSQRDDRRSPRFLNLPTGRAVSQDVAETVVTIARPDIYRPFVTSTEPGNSPPKSVALVVHSSVNEQFDKLEGKFAHLFSLSEGWVRTYARLPCIQSDYNISTSSGALWGYMTKVLYPNDLQESHYHAVALLGDPAARPWYIMRILVTYCFENMLTVDAFYGYSEEIDSELDKFKREGRGGGKLKQNYLSSHSYSLKTTVQQRSSDQATVDAQAALVQLVVGGPNYSVFRTLQLGHHSKRLRDLLGTLLDAGVNRGQAGKDLGTIVVVAWDLAVEMYTSHFAFQIYFPELTSMYTAGNMVARNMSAEDPYQLQLKQTKLKLVMTPVITVRDCRNQTVKTKNLHYSHVLAKN